MFPHAMGGEAVDFEHVFSRMYIFWQAGKTPVISLFTGIGGLDLAFSKPWPQAGLFIERATYVFCSAAVKCWHFLFQ